MQFYFLKGFKMTKTQIIDSNTPQMLGVIGKISAINYLKEKKPLSFVRTYGCQQNVSDGEKIKGLLEQMGYGFAKSTEEADFIIFNTCAIRENAELKVFGNVGELKKLKKKNPELVIALCGCMMQQEHIVEKIKKSYPYVDIVFGTQAIQTLPKMLLTVLEKHSKVFDTQLHSGVIVENLPIHRDGDIKAWVPIMYGCDNFCTYCIVPYVRGREVSREPQAVLDEVKALVDAGYKDITLLGQNVNSYGKTLEPVVSENGEKIQVRFPQLLKMIDEIDGDFVVRFMTSHPKDCTRDLIDVIADSKHISHHIHLPVQSGNNRVLDMMNRRYTVEKYLELVEYAKSRIDDVAFTSDIIVGFPGETYEEFLDTLKLIKKVGYDSLYTFIYSRRRGTKAAEMPDCATDEEKSKWFRELLKVQDEVGYERYLSYVGKTQRVLLDGESTSKEGYLTGRNSQNILIEVPADKSMIGKFVNVKFTKAVKWALVGEIIK